MYQIQAKSKGLLSPSGIVLEDELMIWGGYRWVYPGYGKTKTYTHWRYANLALGMIRPLALEQVYNIQIVKV